MFDSIFPSFLFSPRPFAPSRRKQAYGQNSGLLGCRPYQLISLRHNRISGHLPSFVSSISLKTLDVSSNLHTGPIPPELGLNPFLTHLYLNSNGFTGAIPREVGIQGLETLDVRSNNLSGYLPETLGVKTLRNLRVSDNEKLEGPLPESFGHLSILETFEALSTGLRNPEGARNSRGENLPEFLTFASTLSDYALSLRPRNAQETQVRPFIA